MDRDRFWEIVDQARGQATDPADAADVAERSAALLAGCGPEEIVRAQQILWELMAASYRAPLWAAAYLINDGCSDDLFDYFRGWLIAQGRSDFERVVEDPDALAALPAIREAVDEGMDLGGEDMLNIALEAYETATGAELPGDSFTIDYPELDPAWDFDFDDFERIAERLPRVAELYA
ncbi:DUF4240 domain-containing protein [Streptomyces sp. A7024]|uniref:DUF4240 domain-containing protein n=1 Tax=Streptomyces coryli TaxID=1128680 RepID=A0A6G4UCU4_9ACTN|nr:DUF4240 domain-containing protein [Streptomyces coryli]NGN69198.1 DUF4240 domain-containing protein [Streptomyces coryli]